MTEQPLPGQAVFYKRINISSKDKTWFGRTDVESLMKHNGEFWNLLIEKLKSTLSVSYDLRSRNLQETYSLHSTVLYGSIVFIYRNSSQITFEKDGTNGIRGIITLWHCKCVLGTNSHIHKICLRLLILRWFICLQLCLYIGINGGYLWSLFNAIYVRVLAIFSYKSVHNREKYWHFIVEIYIAVLLL